MNASGDHTKPSAILEIMNSILGDGEASVTSDLGDDRGQSVGEVEAEDQQDGAHEDHADDVALGHRSDLGAQKGSTARSAKSSMRLPGRMMDSRMAIGTNSKPVEIAKGDQPERRSRGRCKLRGRSALGHEVAGSFGNRDQTFHQDADHAGQQNHHCGQVDAQDEDLPQGRDEGAGEFAKVSDQAKHDTNNQTHDHRVTKGRSQEPFRCLRCQLQCCSGRGSCRSAS